MKTTPTPLRDCYLIENTVFKDERGYFFESFNQQTFFKQTGLNICFVQDNQSASLKGVLRGLHFQKGAQAQAKLVRVLEGSVLDVAVDLRKDSPSFGQYFAVELSADNHLQLFVPRGFAHGFVVLSERAVFFYKCDNYYNKAAEGGIRYNDVQLQIDWQIPADALIISEKDRILPMWEDAIATCGF
ncbi:MAG: dTDP-4-dehydrorhamnose 3,5-epimerase [Hydrotalea flava]|uniref:dTDP-4-dehydrorhamnose 3,5-epimerase n=1 Tax=Hydrotalea TaxID=1004300 RepID=UPI0009440CE5|nr:MULTISPECIES: dTDP-4-dehydrorhamnose 3,5-epimerase [Hydrotalea]NIM34373.1 dTDP-4-dehydrorhamnose 3,5-epimerase [Hydrotalea flava]NIM37199.1 dTDP-4-dehydrorhamnose 3,5-epimerase [Hydrotalea flava]NIN02392.1 dTDP-4-dehydrorhamnose 3,5-epimerase [Hydrotalea flava]NIN14044.1 dTDP-4-dehydrorhamnose 3,5-epimerase [Hydrotalea flava]NIO93125.1 dTDP-4-dehydrorhamnose 3,5-epimerase [Hydrotalea flava]